MIRDLNLLKLNTHYEEGHILIDLLFKESFNNSFTIRHLKNLARLRVDFRFRTLRFCKDINCLLIIGYTH